MLTPIADDLWVQDQPLRFLGLQVGARMTVIRTADGGLFVHSPLRPDEVLFRAVDAIGPVRAIVAPNRFHHLFIGPWAERYPASRWSR